MASSTTFPERLAWWRKKRGYSQMQLALTASCSQRHISFLELGRSKPSREMVLRLSDVLDIPLRQSNAMLLAAGFAPVWPVTDLGADSLAPVREALNYILSQQEPFPAVVVDRHWNLLQANKGAVALVEFLVGPIAPGTPINLADALVGPAVLRPHLVNWDAIVRYFVRSVEADAASDATPETAALLERLLGYEDVRTTLAQNPGSGITAPILPMHFQKERTSLRLFTTLATLGTPQDITLGEQLTMDDATRRQFQIWAKGRQPVAARARRRS